MMKRIHVLAAALMLGAAVPALAGPYDQPWSLFRAEPSHPGADTKPATVMKVDGKNTSINARDPFPPGKRMVEVSVPGPRTTSNPTRQTLEVDAKPCTLYRFAAKRSSLTAKDWQAFVASEEPIGECVKKFQGK